MKQYIIDEFLRNQIIKAIAKAEELKIYKDCVVPHLGEKLIDRLHSLETIEVKR